MVCEGKNVERESLLGKSVAGWVYICGCARGSSLRYLVAPCKGMNVNDRGVKDEMQTRKKKKLF